MESLFAINGYVLAFSCLSLLYIGLWVASNRKADPREPPIVSSPIPIPYLGHLFGMLFGGSRYMKKLGLLHQDKPIFTLPLPFSRLYIVTSPPLATAVQRASKSLSFTPLVPDITKRVLGLDAATVDIVRRNLDPEPGQEKGFLADIHDMVYGNLGPGELLEELTGDAIRGLDAELETFFAETEDQKNDNGSPIDILSWTRHIVTIATAKFLYGAHNPIALHPEMEEQFWDFDHGIPLLLLDFFPRFTARKAFRGREAFARAFTTYIRQGWHLENPDGDAASTTTSNPTNEKPTTKPRAGTLLIRQRISIAQRHGWTLEACARSELSFLFAGVVNTATTAFWMIARLFGDEELLQKVREELEAEEQDEKKSGGGAGGGGESQGYKTPNSPTLHSLYKEVLRYYSENSSTRLIKPQPTSNSNAKTKTNNKNEQFILANTYHLQLNSILQISGSIMHSLPSIWGDTASHFDAYRFLDESQQATTTPPQSQPETQPKNSATKTKIHPASLRAFGGGTTLCPGRHFATNEILGFVALMVMKCDIELQDEKGCLPGKDDGVLPVHILEPKRAVLARVSRRRGRRDVGKR